MINNINDYKHISTATTTQVFTGRCSLVAIIVNTTTAGAITIYDNTGSDTTTPVAVLKASVAEGTYLYGGDGGTTLSIGLKIVTAGASDITVIYRAVG